MTGSSTISVPEEVSLARYRRHTRQRGFGVGFLRALAQAIGTALGVGTAVSAAIDQGRLGDPSHVEDELATYLAWVAKKEAVFVTIDNVQFLNEDVRLTIEYAPARRQERSAGSSRANDRRNEQPPSAYTLLRRSLDRCEPWTIELARDTAGRHESHWRRCAGHRPSGARHLH